MNQNPKVSFAISRQVWRDESHWDKPFRVSDDDGQRTEGVRFRLNRKEIPHMSANKAEIESAKAAIQALNQEWEKNFENHDLTGLVALFTEDCVRMPQGGTATVGRPALEAAYRQDFAEVWKTQAKVRLNAGEVIIAGEYAFARGADTLIQDQEDRQVGETGKWLFVYRRQPDGTWKYHWITFNSNE
jgi:uncharacterized protein (TIGR02246 family)